MFFLHVYMYTTCMQCPQKPEEGVRSPGTGVRDTCESLCRYWKMNPGSLQEHPKLLTQKNSSAALAYYIFNFIQNGTILFISLFHPSLMIYRNIYLNISTIHIYIIHVCTFIDFSSYLTMFTS